MKRLYFRHLCHQSNINIFPFQAIHNCDSCGKSFTTKFNLKRHINMHCHKSKVWPFRSGFTQVRISGLGGLHYNVIHAKQSFMKCCIRRMGYLCKVLLLPQRLPKKFQSRCLSANLKSQDQAPL